MCLLMENSSHMSQRMGGIYYNPGSGKSKKERKLFPEDQKPELVRSDRAENETAPSTSNSADQAFEDTVRRKIITYS